MIDRPTVEPQFAANQLSCGKPTLSRASYATLHTVYIIVIVSSSYIAYLYLQFADIFTFSTSKKSYYSKFLEYYYSIILNKL